MKVRFSGADDGCLTLFVEERPLSIFKHYKFNIGLCAVILIVLLRIAIGWHFFYEGVHKFDPQADFTAKGFLGAAKGPAAPLFYMMIPDLDGVQRLEIDTIDTMDKDGKPVKRKSFVAYENAWREYYGKFTTHYAKVFEEQPDLKKQIDEIYRRYLVSLHDGAADVESDVKGFKESLDRYNEMKRNLRNDTEFEQVRRWDAMMKYRSEAGTWINMLDGMSDGLQSDMARVISPQLAGTSGEIVTQPEKAIVPNPISKSQLGLLDFTVSISLTAIGFCIMVGLCNRLACLGGAVFLLNVILTTWPVPGVHPPLPTAVGNFMFVSKDAVELIAMVMLASIPAGRWAGLDYFLWHFGGKSIAKRFGLGET